MINEYLSIEKNNDRLVLKAKGEWTLSSVPEIERILQRITYELPITWDVSAVREFDSAGVLLFTEYFKAFSGHTPVEVAGYTKNQKEMYDLLKEDGHVVIKPPREENLLETVGKNTIMLLKDMKEFIEFLGHVFYAFLHMIIHPREIRMKEIVYHIHQAGFNALIIIGLTSFLVGMVIAYQGAVQLAKFGADIFIVDTVAISITRELGPMITAIVIAGRSGSSYTAEIGAMKITEEIAAMRTMGFDPYAYLVLPRIIAMMVALPLLIFFADIVGIFGGMVASGMQLGISMTQFIDRLYEVLEVKHYILGMIKGPVFAFLIASVGAFRGFQVSHNTESIGLHTTASVVNGIFLVIAFDALFSVIYTELDL
ncbi:MlaE family lipid ABC transporter permease subunit [Sulfurovum sp.]|jgi:phospholipid/cholesterol/gamma-HCH transport system permease protein|uniref:ABC transporter permease n=1 Tax=Sulfurovum sp. TaxID=1969726 RepID=UPI002A364EF9|nr:MlaE family lipid ABC transporter permease subunit [Sulfurovum sp.]MDD2451237.1 MlaE family lipid ABC transporter permease subunit [Sulfurovum sp.]MDD3499820.1 MlaE family lipid ABC transporter permease subunit [Sulfurovum sp.]MDY0403443.1 MlaE family lipid ABC transporter permease subunit [Sulfurovum sp.]